ncbi:hypothetical protein C725_1397 [Pacificimonas flava]|uniref:Uncharacterized protein n=1 Tax=Pacificimonas flava TaxID=1234595 RepID=M2TP19_9SPHN|nr:hypothetical protein C725_1397 [Pacificimonas flava]
MGHHPFGKAIMGYGSAISAGPFVSNAASATRNGIAAPAFGTEIGF